MLGAEFRGLSMRRCARDPTRLREHGAEWVEVVAEWYRDADNIGRAIGGVHSVFYAGLNDAEPRTPTNTTPTTFRNVARAGASDTRSAKQRLTRSRQALVSVIPE